jgi:hypothetical protein
LHENLFVLLRKIIPFLAIVLCLSLLFTIIPSMAVAEGDSGQHLLLSEGAEEETFDEWNVRWERFDANTANAVTDADWWCRTTHNVHEGDHAVWCARNGFNSHYQIDGVQPWNVNITGITDADAPQSEYKLRYDTEQDSIMRKELDGAWSFGTVNMTFWFWSDTGTSDAKQPDTGASVGYDFLNAIYYTRSAGVLTKHVLWTDTYAQATARSWTQVTVAVPNNAVMVGFEFVSGTVPPAGGDPMREGVYLDDIQVDGAGSASLVLPATSVEALAPAQNGTEFSVNFTVNEPSVPFAYVNLYYRVGDSDQWTKYAPESDPDGRFTASPINFTAPGNETYEFATQGFDEAGDSEPFPTSPDASTIVGDANSTAPTTTQPGTPGTDLMAWIINNPLPVFGLAALAAVGGGSALIMRRRRAP